jgi:nitroreductase
MFTKDDVLAAFQFRHACKQFDPAKKISDDDFAFILETGRLSPSSFGFEPWYFVVIQNPELREKLRTVVWGAQGTLPTASHYVAILCRKDDMRFDSPFITHLMRDVQKLPEEIVQKKGEKFKSFQESEFKLTESSRTLFDWACKQAYIALGNMMTAAALIGIDSCPIEGYDIDATEAMLADSGILDKEKFGLAVMVAFGYRVTPQPSKTRQSMEDVTAWVR